MRFGRKKEVKPDQPWMEKTILINDKPTTLRIVRKYATDMAEEDYRNPAEQGLAMTVIALVDEISLLNAQLLEVKKETNYRA
jgi:hypothetical protein